MKAKRKPWGHEYLIYENQDVAIWHLFINKWERTSLHCHPNKKTGLIVLQGGAKVRFLNGEQKVFTGEKVEDSYGRAGVPYGDEDDVDVPDKSLSGSGKWERIGDCDVCVRPINSLEELGAPDLIMITQGGISFNEYTVAGPGDTLDRKTFASLAHQFSIDPSTEGVFVRSCMTH